MGDPLDVGDDCGAFPAGEVLHSDLEVFHDCIGVNAGEVSPKLVMSRRRSWLAKAFSTAGFEGRNVVGLRHLSSTREGDDVFGKPLQLSDHCAFSGDCELPLAPTTGVVSKNRVTLDRSVGQW